MSASGLNFIDLIILAIFVFSALVGFGRGLIGEVISLLTLIAAFAIAIMFASPLSQVFTTSSVVQSAVTQSTSTIGMNTAQPVSYLALALSFGLLFAATCIVGAVLKTILNLAFNVGILGIGNRILGAGFGLVRGYLINLVLIFLVQLSPFSSEPWWQQSKFVNDYQPSVAWLGSIVSPALTNLKARVGTAVQSVGSTIQNYTQ